MDDLSITRCSVLYASQFSPSSLTAWSTSATTQHSAAVGWPAELHLTSHHFLLTASSSSSFADAPATVLCEQWIPFSLIASIERQSVNGSSSGLVYITPASAAATDRPTPCIPLLLCTKHFLQLTLYLPAAGQESQMAASMVMDSVVKLFATSTSAHYETHLIPALSFREPTSSTVAKPLSTINRGDDRLWADYERMGVGTAWRFTDTNRDYSLCSTYPRLLVVPSRISDAVLFHAAKHRSRNRFPALTYLHAANQASITRSSQPMVGIKAKRSIQDEKLIEAIFLANQPLAYSSSGSGGRLGSPSLSPVVSPTGKSPSMDFQPSSKNIIIDARPLGNAMANRAMGAGTESTEHYKNCDRLFMNIDNIHVMRDSLNRLLEAVRTCDSTMHVDKWSALVEQSSWLKHIRTILEATELITDAVQAGDNVLIHCSDGWDRTAQLSSLASVCLDPHYRTLNGFQTLIEKEWLAFGHKFADRCGHHIPPQLNWAIKTANQASSGKEEKETSPVFLQFLECIGKFMMCS